MSVRALQAEVGQLVMHVNMLHESGRAESTKSLLRTQVAQHLVVIRAMLELIEQEAKEEEQ
jgi:hypothetical protein